MYKETNTKIKNINKTFVVFFIMLLFRLLENGDKIKKTNVFNLMRRNTKFNTNTKPKLVDNK